MSVERESAARPSSPLAVFAKAWPWLALVALIVVAEWVGAPENAPATGVRARDDAGRLAAYALLARLGEPVASHHAPPRDLVRDGRAEGALWMPNEPTLFESEPAPASTGSPESGPREAAGEGAKAETGSPRADEEGRSTRASEEAARALASVRDPFGRDSYREYVEAGGTLIVTVDESLTEFLRAGLGARALASACETAASGGELDRARDERLSASWNAEPFRLSRRRERWLAAGDGASGAAVLIARLAEGAGARDARSGGKFDARGRADDGDTDDGDTDDGDTDDSDTGEGADVPAVLDATDGHFALVERVGAGRVVLLAEDTFVTNGAIADLDHAALVVALARESRGDGLLFFDEFALGDERRSGLAGLLFGAGARFASWHWVAWFALFLWRAAWRRDFPSVLEPVRALSPLERTRAEASLVLRANRPELLAGPLRLGLLTALAHDLGVRVDAATRSATEPGGENEAAADLLVRLGRAAGLSERIPEWRAQVFGRTARNEADLRRLEGGIAAIGEAFRERRPVDEARS